MGFIKRSFWNLKFIIAIVIICGLSISAYYLFKPRLIDHFLADNNIVLAKLVDPNDSQVWKYYYRKATDSIDYQNLLQLLEIAPDAAPPEAINLINNIKDLENSSLSLSSNMQNSSYSDYQNKVFPDNCQGNYNALKCYLIFRKSGLTESANRVEKYLENVYPESDIFDSNDNQTKTKLRKALFDLSN